MTTRKWILLTAVIVASAIIYLGWKFFRPAASPEGFASGNGRIEAVDIDVATRAPGRLAAVLVNEGDLVTTGQVLAQMDTGLLMVQLREAEAQLRRAQSDVETARSGVVQRESEKTAALSVVAQRKAELDAKRNRLARREKLALKEVTPAEQLEDEHAAFYSAEAAFNSAHANVAAAEAAITTAKSQVIGSEASVEAAQAIIARIRVDINDYALKSPCDGRVVQCRIAHPGEVLNAGGPVLKLVDLGSVYMTFFLPTSVAGRIEIGSEVRLVLDAASQYVIPALVSFVADVAQPTPTAVETADDRQKLMLRIKARIDPQLLKHYIRSIKTGLTGIAYVRLDPNAKWPANLEGRIPQ
ncbi:MAG: HlyD family efflux transporter periplasmic adaptor subunit [Desulfomonile sp.]|jgi:HlyD family secretion protein